MAPNATKQRAALRRRFTAAAAVAWSAGLCLGAGPTTAPSNQYAERPARHDAQPQSLSGTIGSYNLNAMGLPDAMMVLVNGNAVQVNCPPMLASVLPQLTAVGDAVKLSVEPERAVAEADHAVYRLLSLTTANGRVLAVHPDGQPASVHVEATVKQLNYGRRGEINGALLDSGDLLHIAPPSAAQLKLAVGAKLSIDGVTHPMLLGHNVIDARSVNGTTLAADDRPRVGLDGPPGDGSGPRERGADPRSARGGRGGGEGLARRGGGPEEDGFAPPPPPEEDDRPAPPARSPAGSDQDAPPRHARARAGAPAPDGADAGAPADRPGPGRPDADSDQPPPRGPRGNAPRGNRPPPPSDGQNGPDDAPPRQ